MAILFGAKLNKANQMLGSDEKEVHNADVLFSSDLAQFVHFIVTNIGFDGSV